MNIQKKKLIGILVKVQTLKNKYITFKLQKAKQLMHCLLMLYFIFIHTNASLQNTIFTFSKKAHVYLLQYKELVTILTTILLAICILTLASVLLLALIQGKYSTEITDKNRKVILYLTVGLSIIFDYFGFLLVIGIISNLNITNSSLIISKIVSIFTLVLTSIIIFYSRSNILFSYRLILVLLAFELLGNIPANLILIVLSAYQLYFTKNNRAAYLLLLVINFIIFLAGCFEANISNLQLITVSAIVLLIHVLKFDGYIVNKQSQNDFLLSKLTKLRREQKLSSKQIRQIVLIFEGLRRKRKVQVTSKQRNIIQLISQDSLTKQLLSQLIQLKLNEDEMMNPSNFHIQIQRFQCQLTQNTLNISAMYAIYKLRCRVIQKASYSQNLRMQQLINQIEDENFRNEGQINSSLVISAQKQLQRFYYCIGQGIEQLIDLWTSLSKSSMYQSIFTQSLRKAACLQDQAHQILQGLKRYKKLTFEIQVINYLHRIINADGEKIMVNQPTNCYTKLKQTEFILVGNNIIEDASKIISKQLSPYQSLLGRSINEVLYSFYSQYMSQDINNLISLSQNRKEVLIPFKMLNHQNKFILAQCAFYLLPDIDHGVKYIIKFIKQDYSSKYVLYCLQQDIIYAFSNCFYQKYRLSQSQLPDIILGQNFFRPDLSCLFKEDVDVETTVKCELKLSNFKSRRKNIKMVKRYHSYLVTLKVKQIYTVNALNYLLLEISSKDETSLPSAKQSLNILIQSTKSTRNTYNMANSKVLCKIVNPLQAIINQKFSRINVSSRISYSKIVTCLAILMIILVLISLIYLKVESQTMNDSLNQTIGQLSLRNSFIQTAYQLFYQYYQYYQILNYPNQFLKIYKYDIKALIKQYYKKVDANIASILPYIFTKSDQMATSTFTAFYPTYNQQLSANKINLLGFLQNAKQSLTRNSPLFMVRNQHAIDQIIDNFPHFRNDTIKSFSTIMFNYIIGCMVSLIGFCLVIKVIYFRVCFFKWKIFQIYASITQEQRKVTVKKLSQFLIVLTQNNYYDIRQRRSENLIQTVDLLKEVKDEQAINDKKNSTKQIGIIRDSYLQKVVNNNLIFIIPIVFIVFFIFYQKQVNKFTDQSLDIIQYSKQLQTFSVLILQRATDYFQVGMEVIMDQSQRNGWKKSQILVIPTELTVQLPAFFSGYKQIQQQMLQFNLCEYSYLNTGSLYKNINCSAVLDGIMDKSFTQTYYFLLQNLQQFGGAPIEQFGNQYRPGATYPFYMQICYTRRTINNMLAYIQTQFTITLTQYLESKQEYLQTTIKIGFVLLPIFIIIVYTFSKQIKDQCYFAIKCFKIIPRNFLMKIAISKKLKQNGLLDQIELVAV